MEVGRRDDSWIQDVDVTDDSLFVRDDRRGSERLKRQLEYKSNQDRKKNDIPEQKKNKTQAQVPVLFAFREKKNELFVFFPTLR
jgi:hypothetical protein